SSLSQVIIVKLPFSVPNDPVFAARAEEVERRGGSSFMELSLPEAVIKFRQGFGRLVRRSTDKGAVVVLDRRIMEKRYGKIFLDSLPQTKRLYAPLGEVCDAVERLLD
ncbi:MAG: helicase, partial [Treponema sp.]|nr:helicase [Treponema sp.]